MDPARLEVKEAQASEQARVVTNGHASSTTGPRSVPVRDGIAGSGKSPLPKDPMQQIEQLAVEDLMAGHKPDPSGSERAFETLSILLLLLCLGGVLIYASLSSTTVVVAAPPGLEALSPGAVRAPAP
jgi:hypothetical protein